MPKYYGPSTKTKIAQKRGRGFGKQYRPWIEIDEVPSMGRSTRSVSWTVGRVHHMLSDLETKYFYLLDWSSIVTDIREQYPLLPIKRTQEIAEQLGIKHPHDGEEPIGLTTDFVVSVSDKIFARTIKYNKDLHSKRTMEKFEIERVYWNEQGVDWGIVTEEEIPDSFVENVKFLHKAYFIEDLPPDLNENIIFSFETSLLRKINKENKTPLNKVCIDTDKLLGFPPGTALTIVKYFIASKKWIVDMFTPR